MNDVGLITSLYGIAAIKKILSRDSNINYGAIYKNFVAQELHAHGYPGYYYKSKNMVKLILS